MPPRWPSWTTRADRAISARPDLADTIETVVGLVRSVPVVATRWEQLTSPTMAKGAEDRAFYRYLRLPSLCEVGGAPGEFSTSVDEFHRHHAQVQATDADDDARRDDPRHEAIRRCAGTFAGARGHCGHLVRRRACTGSTTTTTTASTPRRSCSPCTPPSRRGRSTPTG
jgi:hypothetical protein